MPLTLSRARSNCQRRYACGVEGVNNRSHAVSADATIDPVVATASEMPELESELPNWFWDIYPCLMRGRRKNEP